ncbi:hypothetical protein ACAG25_15760 [Mycobacterium sp. pV006]|uniref:hypothetical protein n=1 Tax=Mycobacterium sp. pV006 TaxID=3238983 RepID=UPI00351ABD60
MSFVDAFAACLTVAGVVVGLVSWVRFQRPLVALRAMLECFTGAGLLQLSMVLSWPAVFGVAALIAVQYVVVGRLTADLMSTEKAGH